MTIRWRFRLLGVLTVLFTVSAALLAMFPGAAQGVTPAGTRIASVSSVSCFFEQRVFGFDSNPVLVDILQVSQVGIAPQRRGTARPGKSVTFSHAITNRGNVADLFNIEAATGSQATIELFAADGVTPLTDTNGDGKADTSLVAAGAEVGIVVSVTLPGTARAGEAAEVTVRAVSTVDQSVAASVVDQASVLSPEFTASQTVTPAGQITPGTTLSYLFTFSTQQDVSASNVVISDTLDSHLDYVPGSATPPQGVAGATSSYDSATRTVTWRIPSIPAGYSGTVGLRARVNPATSSATTISNVMRIASDEYPEGQASNAVVSEVVEQPLRIAMTAGKSEAEIGEFVPFTVVVENVSTALTTNDVQVIGTFPKGFRYAKGSSTLDNVALSEPSSAGDTVWSIGAIRPGEKRTLVYRAIVSVDATRGDGINSARAVGLAPGGAALASETATATVKVVEGVLNSKTMILGRVFVDLNRDRMPDADEPGMQGVRVYLEDGSFAITDGEGKFSIIAADPGEHVLKLDRSTVPAGFEPAPLDTTFAGDGGSRFITAPFGGLARGDFGLIQLESGLLPQQHAKAPPKEERVLTFGSQLNPGPPPLEEQIRTMPPSPEILEPAAGSVLRKRWTDVVIRVPDGAAYALRVNDTALPQNQIGKTIVDSKRNIRICRYVGVSLEAGSNRITLELPRPGGRPELKEVEVVAPGDAVRLELSPDKSDIPADGKTVVPYSVTFLDQANRRTAGEVTYTVLSEKGEILEPDLDKATAGHQLKAVDGKGSFRLRSTSKTGAERITVTAGTRLQGSAEVFFTPEMREWIVVGLGSLTVGRNGVSGKVENLANNDNFEKGIYQDGRLAFFAKGKILGQYLLTASYDSGREERSELFQRVDPNKYYPIYGDASVQGYEAQSQKKYYVRIERERSSLLVGDYNTELSTNEFTRYDRSFNGVRADIDTKNVSVRAFGSSTNHSANRDEIAGNGTSGYYFLSKKPIIENTEKVRIEIRDRYHSETVLSVTSKSPYTDYTLDYRTGALLFREPVSSYDANLNPVRIVILYESEDAGDENHIYGGRAAIRNEKGSQLGVTAVVEEKGSGSDALYGLDAALRIGESTVIRSEGARSETVEKGEGTAWKVELSSKVEKAMVEAYVRRVGEKFYNISMTGTEVGSEKYGGKISYSLLEKTKIIAEAFVQSGLTTDKELTYSALGLSQGLGRFTTDAGFRYLEGDDGGGEMTTSRMVYAGVSGKVTEKLEGAILQEQAFESHTVKDYPSRTLLKLNYKVSERNSVFVTEEIRESGKTHGNNATMGITSKLYENVILTTSYQETAGTEATSQFGTELSSKWEPAKAVSFSTKTGYQIQDTLTGERGVALMGVHSSWEVIKGLRIGAKAERVQLVTGTSDPAGVNTALALSAAYLGSEELKATARYEFRHAPSETTNLYTLSGAWKMSRSVSLLGKGSLWTSDKSTGNEHLFDGQVGAAYRPLGRNSLYLLGVIRFKDDSKGSSQSSQSSDEDVKSGIASFEASDRVVADLTVHAKYAGKYSWDTLNGTETRAYTDMILAGARYDVTEKLDLGVSAKIMTQYRSGTRSLGVIPEVGYRLVKNARVAVGYNFSRLNDSDLAGEEYSASGPFIQLKVKFDEMSIQGAYQSVFGKPVSAVTIPPPAASPPAVADHLMAVVRSSLVEEEVEVVGSVEALKVLVNDREAPLPRADATIELASGDEVIELKGGDAAKPVEFRVSASAPEKIASWTVTVSGPGEEAVDTIRGEGAPATTLRWQIRDSALLKGGELYRYRLEVAYADGSRVTSPFRLFGVNRSSAVSVSLTGGAFASGSATLSRKAKTVLKETAALMRKHPLEKVIIEGHTDAVGNEQANMELSRKRSQAAADYLVQEEKIPAERLMVRWFGKSRPIASNDLPEGRELNRRVEVKGEFSQTKRVAILDQHRVPPLARINGSAAGIDPLGRFAGKLAGKRDAVEIEMVNSDGRSIRSTVPLPKAALTREDGSAGERVACRIDEARPLQVPYRFSGKAGAGDSLAVNGKEIAVAADGTFTFDLELPEGERSYWMQVRNRDGYCKGYRLAVSVAREKR